MIIVGSKVDDERLQTIACLLVLDLSLEVTPHSKPVRDTLTKNDTKIS